MKKGLKIVGSIVVVLIVIVIVGGGYVIFSEYDFTGGPVNEDEFNFIHTGKEMVLTLPVDYVNEMLKVEDVNVSDEMVVTNIAHRPDEQAVIARVLMWDRFDVDVKVNYELNYDSVKGNLAIKGTKGTLGKKLTVPNRLVKDYLTTYSYEVNIADVIKDIELDSNTKNSLEELAINYIKDLSINADAGLISLTLDVNESVFKTEYSTKELSDSNDIKVSVGEGVTGFCLEMPAGMLNLPIDNMITVPKGESKYLVITEKNVEDFVDKESKELMVEQMAEYLPLEVSEFIVTSVLEQSIHIGLQIQIIPELERIQVAVEELYLGEDYIIPKAFLYGMEEEYYFYKEDMAVGVLKDYAEYMTLNDVAIEDQNIIINGNVEVDDLVMDTTKNIIEQLWERIGG